jgi:hypothetical protein
MTIRRALAAALMSAAFILPASAQPTLSLSLEAGFTPDPDVSRVTAGGTREIDEDDGTDCTGYVGNAPTARLLYTAGREALYIWAESQTDTVLMIRGPDGRVSCNDDRDEGLDPGVAFENPVSGEYEIWVGTYDEEEPASAELRISEIGFAAQAADEDRDDPAE